MGNKRKKEKFNAIAVPDKEIFLDGCNIYGVLYNQEEEAQMQLDGNSILEYVRYAYGSSVWLKVGGDIREDGKIWYFDDGQPLISTCKFQRLIYTLMKEFVKIKRYEFEDFIEIHPDETGLEESRFVTNKSLLDRVLAKAKNVVEEENILFEKEKDH